MQHTYIGPCDGESRTTQLCIRTSHRPAAAAGRPIKGGSHQRARSCIEARSVVRQTHLGERRRPCWSGKKLDKNAWKERDARHCPGSQHLVDVLIPSQRVAARLAISKHTKLPLRLRTERLWIECADRAKALKPPRRRNPIATMKSKLITWSIIGLTRL